MIETVTKEEGRHWIIFSFALIYTLYLIVITKRKRDEDETAGIAQQDILQGRKYGPRALTSRDSRKKPAKSFETCTLEVGTLHSNIVRGPQKQQMQMVNLNC